MIDKRKILILCVALVLLKTGYSQNVFVDLRSLEKRGDYYYSKLVYTKAADLYFEALKKKKNKYDYQLNIRAAGLYRKMGRYEEAKNCYNNIVASGHTFDSQDSIEYFNVLRAVGDPKADTIFSNVYSRVVLNNLFRDTLYYNIYELPFNTEKSEYCPMLLRGGLMFVYDDESSSIVKKYNALNNGGFANLYYTEMSDTGWSAPAKTQIDVENILHAGPASFYNSNKNAILNLCKEEGDEPYRLLLYSTEYDEGKKQWKNLLPLPFNSESYSVSHPAVTGDGKKIFFISDMEGGKGGTDIYVSELAKGSWSDPVNIGDKINTKGNEKYPFISNDNILFFSSDGRYGLGGLDIYYVDLDFKDSIVVNMGFPINSALDDFGFSFDKIRKTGYFSSNRKSNGKQDDLYLYTENRILLGVTLMDDFNKKNLEGVTVELWDNELIIPIRYSREGQSGILDAWLRPNHEYRMILRKEDYKSDTLKVSTYGINDFSKTITRIVHLKRKPVYYANLKLKNEAFRESLSGSLIVVNNLTDKKKDTLDHVNASEKIKLDADCEYIITLRKGDKLRYIYVEKKPIKISSSIPYYNLYLTLAKPSVLHVRIKKCKNEKQKDRFEGKLVVSDWVNGNKFNISPGLDGDFQLVVIDYRLFDLFVNGKKISYSNEEIVLEDYCIVFVNNNDK